MANNAIMLTPSKPNEVVCQRQADLGTSLTKSLQVNSYWIDSAKQLAAGGLSGCVEVFFTYPTEYVKILLQLDERSVKPRYNGVVDVVKQTIHQHGGFGFYRGFSVILLGAFPKYMFRFGSYEQIKRFYEDEDGQLSPRNKMICGLGAGISEALFVVVPQESIKVKFINDRISERPKYKGLLHGIREIVHEQGLRGTYQGVWPTVLKQGSNQAIRFFVFDSLKDWYCGKDSHSKDNINKAVVPVFGAIAGAISVLCNTPFDVVKTRMQGLEASRYKNMSDCIAKIYRNEGSLAFYKGITPRLAKVTLEVAIAFTMYQVFLDLFFKSYHKNSNHH